MNYQGKKAAFQTLGCKLNFSETSAIAHTLEQAANAGGAPAIIQMMMGTDELKHNVLMGMSMTWVVGGHLAAYVASRGQHCLFGMIDPELCKENML